MSNNETKTICACEICKKEITLDAAIQCEFCNTDTASDKESDKDTNTDTEEKEPHLFCKRCTGTCFACEEIGCDKCVDVVCCDCAVTMCSECRNGDKLCGCYGKCYRCDTYLDRGKNGWPCNECEKWYCHDCGLTNNSCKECGPEEESEEDESEEEAIKTTYVCESCKTDITLETAIPCNLCDREDDYNEGKISPLFCKECTLYCDACEEVQGCKKCVQYVCCDCHYNMCYECRNNDDIICGCFGECYSCGRDVNRDLDGRPCNECEKWYCYNCCPTSNCCKECV